MTISFSDNSKISRINIGHIIQVGLINSSQKIARQARENAPYDTGKLKQSISVEPQGITTGTRRVKIGPRSLVYAIRREHENYKNPHKKFYMRRTGQVGDDIVKEEFEKASKIVISSI